MEMQGGGDDRLREATLEALARFRRRADAAGSGARTELIVRGAEAGEAPKRRDELIEWAGREHGLSADRAALIHDIAREEGLDPAFAFELVHCGVGVQDLREPSAGETSLDGPP